MKCVATKLLLALLGCTLLTGCGRAVTMANYERIEVGMTEAEVTSILGKGQEQASSEVSVPGQSISIPGAGSASFSGMSSSMRMVNWQDGDKMIGVVFTDGKVVSKSQFGL